MSKLVAWVKPFEEKTGPLVKIPSESDKDWHDKAKRLIGIMCYAEYLRTNTKQDGGFYKEHRPYSVPEAAQLLINCLNTNDEKLAKSLMMHNYELTCLVDDSL